MSIIFQKKLWMGLIQKLRGSVIWFINCSILYDEKRL